MNYEFLEFWDELDTLNESKADTQKLVDFAGQKLADRFLAIRNKLKSPENDLYYWIKNKTPADLAQVIQEVENAKSNTQIKKDVAEQGAKLVCESAHWYVYHITTFDAAVKYGKDTKWCITGLQNSGDKYWKHYKEKGADFYFLITKENYDARGRNSKFALALYDAETYSFDDADEDDFVAAPGYEIYDQQDYSVLLEDVPYINEIKIPGIKLTDFEPLTGRTFPCDSCNDWITEDQYELNVNIYGQHLCFNCYKEYESTLPSYAEDVVILSKEPAGIMKSFIEGKFQEYGSDIVEVLNAWIKGRKNNLFKIFTEKELVDMEHGFIKNLETFTGLKITIDMLQGKEELKL
jgi:hypothetical protein